MVRQDHGYRFELYNFAEVVEDLGPATVVALVITLDTHLFSILLLYYVVFASTAHPAAYS